MNTTAIIQSNQALEDSIKALVSDFKEAHNLSGIEVNSCTHTLCMEGCFNVVKHIDINVTATINEDGAEIIIR